MENPSAILKHRGKNYSLKDISETCPNLTVTEKKIVRARLEGKSFELLDEKDIRTSIDQIMLRGAAISGCPLPQTDFFAEFIASELTYFMIEMGYSLLTLDEILLALRLNARGLEKYPSGETVDRIEFSGNCFHVTFIAKVLSTYSQLRRCLDTKLQNLIDGY